MLRTALASLTLSCFALACGSSKGATADASVVFIDSGAPDAPVQACAKTLCGADCVDLATDPNHCGACDMACDSPGQVCAGSVPCACPAAFIDATVDPAFGDQVTDQQGIHIGLAPLFGATTNLFVVGYTDVTPVGTDIVLTGDPSAPFAAAAYDVNIQSMTAHTAYAVTAGTLHLDTACSVGATGTLTGATFSEATQSLPPTVVPGGCTFDVPTVTFTIGTACPVVLIDAGPV